MKILKNLNLVLLTLIFTACTTVDYKPETVSQDQAGKIQTILLGTILDLRLVTIEGDRDLGSAAGAIIVGDLASDNDKAKAIKYLEAYMEIDEGLQKRDYAKFKTIIKELQQPAEDRYKLEQFNKVFHGTS